MIQPNAGDRESPATTARDASLLAGADAAAREMVARSGAALASLREGEERLRRTMEGLDAIVVHQPFAGGPLLVSPQVRGPLGYTPDQVATVAAWNGLVHPEDLPRCREAWASPTLAWRIEFRMRHADGTWRWVGDHGHRVPDDDGRMSGAFGIVTDVTVAHQAADQLRQSEERFRAFFEESPEVMGILRPQFDADGRMTDAEVLDANRSTRLRHFDGLSREAVLGERLFERWPHLLGAILGPVASVAETGVPFQGEVRLSRDGVLRWSDVSIFPFEGGLAFIGRDISARKRAELDLQASEARYRAVADSAADAIVTAGGRATIVGWNRGAERMFGWPAQEMIGQPLVTLMPESMGGTQTAAFGRFVGDPKRHVTGALTALTGRRKDGSDFPLELSLSDWTLDGQRYVTAIIRDVSERHVAEAAVREAQSGLRRLARAIDQTSDAVLVADQAGDILYVNPAFERLSGHALGEATRQDLRLLGIGAGTPGFDEELRTTFAAIGTWQGELVNQRKDGTRYTVDASISPVLDDAGAVSAHVAVIRDVTAERELEARLRQSQRLEAVGQLAGGVAHDFNNLLAAITGYAEFVRAALPEDGEARRDIDEVLRASSRAADLTGQLLAFSRRQPPVPVALDPAEVVEGLAPMLQRLLGDQVALVVVNEGSTYVLADRGQLEQVFVNLAVNARDAMPDGGRFIIDIRMALLDQADAGEVPRGPVVRITVADTGAGIDEETLPRIFDPFFTTKAVGKGTGLGLATTYGIVRASGGRIAASSGQGLGATFTIDLPPAPADALQAVPARVVVTTLPVGAAVLLVEDDPMVRPVLARHLLAAGSTVHQATSAEDALAIWPDLERVDIVVSDVRMPGIGGAELARRLRTLRPGLPVLLISGYADDLALDEPALAGITLLDKPFDGHRFVDAVRSALEAASQAS